MAERYFSPAEVEALIPALTELVDGIRAAHRKVAEVREQLQGEQRRIALSGGGIIDQDAWRADRGRLEALARRLQEALDGVAALGGIPKDLGLGLVDFPHLRAGREVNLCWKYGERSIRFWHSLEEGYAGRKPL